MLSEEAKQRIADFEKDQLAHQAKYSHTNDNWVKDSVEQKRLLEENRSQLEQQYPGLWVGYCGGKLLVAVTERELFTQAKGDKYLVQELMPSKQQQQDQKIRQEFLEQTIPPNATPYFRYKINCADSTLDMSHGGYDLEEMYLPEFGLYFNGKAIFFASAERSQNPTIKKIYHGYLKLDRSKLLKFVTELRIIDEARKELAKKEEALNPDREYLENFLTQQIKCRDEDPCLTCHHSYYDHRRLSILRKPEHPEECGSAYDFKKGPCQCTKFISGRADFQDELR